MWIKKIRNYHPYGVRNRLLSLFLLSALIPVLIFGSVLFSSSSREMEKEISETYTSLSNQISSLFSEYVTMTDGIGRSVDVTDSVPLYLRMNMNYFDYTPDELWTVQQDALAFLKQVVDMNKSIYSITAVTLDGQMLSCSRGGYERPLYDFEDSYYDPLRSSAGDSVIMPVRNTDYAFSGSQPVFTIGFKHLDTLGSNSTYGYFNDYTGYILIECAVEHLAEFCGSADTKNGCAFYMTNEEALLMYTNDPDSDIHSSEVLDSVTPDPISKRLKIGNDKCLLVGNSPTDTGWRVLTYVPYDVVSARLFSIRSIFIILCVFLVFSILVVAVFVSNSFTKPILQMRRAMKKVQGGELDTRIENDRNDEFGDLYDGFNDLTGRINVMIDNVANARRSEETAKYHMLMSQINPHFLYNTLDSIRMMAVLRSQPEIAKALLHLSNLFRYSIKQQDEPVTVEDELGQAKNYLSLQLMRFGDQLQIIYRIDDAALNARMPKILLQPILENAFSHAFINMEKPGKLTLTVKKNSDRIDFTVKDNGVGMSEDDLIQLRQNLENDKMMGDSVGLANINQRLRLHFSEAHWLKIESSPGRGTTVSFSVPIGYPENDLTTGGAL